MKKLMMLAAVMAVSFVAVSSQATVDCTKSDKGTMFAKRDWSALKAGATAKPAPVQKAVATKKTGKKATF